MLNPMDKLFTAWKSYFIVISLISSEGLHQSDFDACARLMSNYLIIPFLHLGSHYLFFFNEITTNLVPRASDSVSAPAALAVLIP